MNKFRAFIMTFVFVIAALPGFYLGKTTSLLLYPLFRQRQLPTSVAPLNIPPVPSQTPQKIAPATQMPRPSVTPLVLPPQERILLVQVDDLTAGDPALISIWGLFIAFSEQTNLIFKAIYPSNTPSTLSQEIGESFEIEPGKKLSGAYLDKLNTLGIKWDGYILIDNQFIDRYGNAFPHTSLTPFLSPTAEPDSIIRQEEVFLNKTCEYLAKPERALSPQFDWQAAASGHFSSNLKLDFLLMGWQFLLENGAIQNCEVLT